MAEGLVHRLADFVVQSGSTPLSTGVYQVANRALIDLIGVAVAGHDQQPVEAVRRVARNWSGTGEATVLVTGERAPAAVAAMVNGTMAHSLDFDDTHLPSVLHPSASVIPAVMAAAEKVGASGQEVLAAIAIGDEIACRLGMAAYKPDIKNSIFFEHGLHATSICGALGAAAAVTQLCGGDRDAIAHALAIAASMGSGIIEANRSGGSVKPFHCGWAAHAGITASELALAGLTGPHTALEGRFGFYQAHTGGWFDEEALTGGLGERWEIDRLFIKPYPTNHFTHVAVDTGLALRDEGIKPSEIVSIDLGVPGPVLRTIAEPPAEKARPRSGHHAKFSAAFTLATALLGGGGLGVTVSDFTDDSVGDPEKLDLAAKVVCRSDEWASEIFPYQFPGVASVTLRDGSIWEHRVAHTRGGPERPLSSDELELKFRLNASPVFGDQGALELAHAITEVEDGGLAAVVDAAVRTSTKGGSN